MKLAIITPVGPGHQKPAEQAVESVNRAIEYAQQKGKLWFTRIRHAVIDDTQGLMGRSRARNEGMVDADWYFFLDADDRMCKDALTLCNFDAAATFGAVCLDACVYEKNVYPCGWAEIAKFGAAGTLNMGFFCRADIARELRFNEDMDRGEDFDFYMRLPSFVKIEKPLVHIGYLVPSAIGPRGYREIDWVGTCNKVIGDKIRSDSRYGVRGDAVLDA